MDISCFGRFQYDGRSFVCCILMYLFFRGVSNMMDDSFFVAFLMLSLKGLCCEQKFIVINCSH